MPNQINSTNTPKKYDAGDMHDIQSLAAYDMNWMQSALNRVRRDFIKLSVDLQQQGIHSCHFDELKTALEMYSYLAEERHSFHVEMSEQYEKEWQNTKGGEHDNTP
ncbi:hypothetical protein [Acinetobacter indicus]|uniref:hypothetical protein n=1 Tax=Acinetobacter indicus TaxID=756892 RepID=UPI002574990F|nr:hypothetical protein [Acinetobacter indicus]MDM1291177.1 hypothetical protein [Acinetobacter indicus]